MYMNALQARVLSVRSADGSGAGTSSQIEPVAMNRPPGSKPSWKVTLFRRHALLDIKQGLLADSDEPFLRAIQVNDEKEDARKRQNQPDHGQRTAGLAQSRLIAHRSHGEKGEGEEANPDCEGDPAATARLNSHA